MYAVWELWLIGLGIMWGGCVGVFTIHYLRLNCTKKQFDRLTKKLDQMTERDEKKEKEKAERRRTRQQEV